MTKAEEKKINSMIESYLSRESIKNPLDEERYIITGINIKDEKKP